MFGRIFSKLTSRRVLRAAGIYLAATLLILRLAERIGPFFGATEFFQQALALILTLAFPLVLVVAWRYGSADAAGEDEQHGRAEKGTAEILDGDDEVPLPMNRARLIDMALVVVVLAVGFLYLERFVDQETPTEAVAEQSGAEIPNASIAVLPFKNYSDNADFEFFAAGVHEDVLTYLSRQPELLVISRTSVMQYADTKQTVPQIARTLKVAHILEGSVRRAGNRVRITIQLIRAEDDTHLWAENYDRDLTDIFAIQTEVAQQVAQTLSSKINSDVPPRTAPTMDTQAYDWFAQARELIRLPSADSASRGLALFEAAVEKDPQYAEAYAGIALTLRVLSSFDVPWEDVKARATQSARRAIALDTESAYAAYAMGSVLSGLSEDNKRAEVYLQRAIEIDPNYGDAYITYAENLYQQSRYEESFALIQEAARRDPLNPTVQLHQGDLLLMAGQRDQALIHISNAINLDPSNAYSQFVAGRAYDGGNALLTALAHYGKARSLDPKNTKVVTHIAGALTRLGMLPPARIWLEEAARMAPADDEWFHRQSQLLMAEGLYDGLNALATDWERYNPSTARVTQLRASAASLGARAARSDNNAARARTLNDQALEHLQAYLAKFKTNDGYQVKFGNIWSILSLGIEQRMLGIESGDVQFQSVVDLYESQPADVQLPNQRIHLTIAYGALGSKEKALHSAHLSLQTNDYTYWVMRIYGLETDSPGVFHGLAADPEFQQILTDMRADRDNKQQELARRFPAILDPDHPDWADRDKITTSVGTVLTAEFSGSL